MLTKSILVLLLLIVLGGLTAALGLYRAGRENTRIIGEHILTGDPVTIDLAPAVYADLPAPVRRYFDFAFNGQTSVTLTGVVWQQDGEFLLPVVGPFRADGQQISHPNRPTYAFTGWFWRYGLPLIESRDAFFPAAMTCAPNCWAGSR